MNTAELNKLERQIHSAIEDLFILMNDTENVVTKSEVRDLKSAIINDIKGITSDNLLKFWRSAEYTNDD